MSVIHTDNSGKAWFGCSVVKKSVSKKPEFIQGDIDGNINKISNFITGGFEITGTYRCKNRLLKTNIRLTTVQFNVTCHFKKGYFLTCDTHGDHKDDNINKTDALFWMRKPWLWCDECSALHFNMVWDKPVDVEKMMFYDRNGE